MDEAMLEKVTAGFPDLKFEKVEENPDDEETEEEEEEEDEGE